MSTGMVGLMAEALARAAELARAEADYKDAKELGETYEAYLVLHNEYRKYARSRGWTIPRALSREHGRVGGDAKV